MNTLVIFLIVGLLILLVLVAVAATDSYRDKKTSQRHVPRMPAPAVQLPNTGSPKQPTVAVDEAALFIPLRPPVAAVMSAPPRAKPPIRTQQHQGPSPAATPMGAVPFVGMAPRAVAGKRCFVTGNPDRETCGCPSCTNWKQRRKQA